MHYSEPTAGAVTVREHREHIARVFALPPCRREMHLMIEAKDVEQAVIELVRNFKLPGFEKASEMVQFERKDQEQLLAKGPDGKRAGKAKRKRRGAQKKRWEDGMARECSTGRVGWIARVTGGAPTRHSDDGIGGGVWHGQSSESRLLAPWDGRLAAPAE